MDQSHLSRNDNLVEAEELSELGRHPCRIGTGCVPLGECVEAEISHRLGKGQL